MRPRFNLAQLTRPASPKKRAAPLRVSVVVVNFRRRDQAVALVEQLDASECMRGNQAEIVLVDNDADPQPLAQCAGRMPGVRLFSFGKNRGFARAVNEGCRMGRGEWLLLLNPDVSVPPEFLDKVLAAADEITADDPTVGVIGFELQHADGSPQDSAGPFPTLGNVLGGLMRQRESRRCRPRESVRAEVPWVTGCCLLVRQPCWQEMNGFDEDYFLYYEDVDLCRRARNAGWSVWFAPSVPVTHYDPLHRREVPAAMRVVTRHALLTYAAKHWPAWQFRVLSGIVAIESLVRGIGARLTNAPAAVSHYRRLSALVSDLLAGRAIRARSHLLASAATLSEPGP